MALARLPAAGVPLALVASVPLTLAVLLALTPVAWALLVLGFPLTSCLSFLPWILASFCCFRFPSLSLSFSSSTDLYLSRVVWAANL